MIPEEATRYFPSDDKAYIGSGKSIVRFVFYGVPFTLHEVQAIDDFKKFLSIEDSDLLEYPEEEMLRTIIGCKFNFKKALEAIKSAIKWRSNVLRDGLNGLQNKISGLLDSGIIYIHGRDHRYRPLIIINTSKIDLSASSLPQICDLVCFVLEFTVCNLMLPGHIENWIIITDLNNQSLSNLPFTEIKTIIKVLQDNFRCRMIVNYVLNAPRSLKMMWNVIKNFIEPHTVNKIQICTESEPSEIKNHFAMTQIEEKYGGKAPNAVRFWPPILPAGPFETENEIPGAHLSQKYIGLFPNNLTKIRENHFSSRSSDEFYSIISDPISGKTFYQDAVEPSNLSKEIPACTFTKSSTDTLLPTNQKKKCCKNCNLI